MSGRKKEDQKVMGLIMYPQGRRGARVLGVLAVAGGLQGAAGGIGRQRLVCT